MLQVKVKREKKRVLGIVKTLITPNSHHFPPLLTPYPLLTGLRVG